MNANLNCVWKNCELAHFPLLKVHFYPNILKNAIFEYITNKEARGFVSRTEGIIKVFVILSNNGLKFDFGGFSSRNRPMNYLFGKLVNLFA
jgi:hypothetical protein